MLVNDADCEQETRRNVLTAAEKIRVSEVFMLRCFTIHMKNMKNYLKGVVLNNNIPMY